MSRTVVIQKTIRSTRGWSSEDLNIQIVTQEYTLPSIPEVGEAFLCPNEALNGEKLRFKQEDDLLLLLQLEADRTKTARQLMQHTEKAVLQKYAEEAYLPLGWEIQTQCHPEVSAFLDRESERKAWRAKEQGLVNWKLYMQREQPPEDYQGGLSDTLFAQENLQNYIKSGCVYGWMGNITVRTPLLDEVIERTFKAAGATLEEIDCWLTSTDGRHFADSLEDLEKEQRPAAIQANIERLYNKAIIFNHPEHRGSLKSSYEIEAKLRKEGQLFEGYHYPTQEEFEEYIQKTLKNLPDEEHP